MLSNIALVDQLTRFVGRETELNELNQLLNNADCRLLTLVGVGGIGKTRLAVQVAKQHQQAFVDGVWFVNLEPLRSGKQIASAVLDIIGVKLTGSEPLEDQLLQYLQDRKLLLLLDNFEHVLDGVGILTKIIRRAPDVKLLVTSRQSLSLPVEWTYPVEGLPTPQNSQAAGIEPSAAVALFVERARRVRPHFSLGDSRASVVHICQLVDGLPLAIEIAASWTTTLRCSEIAAEIQSNLNFLTSNLRHVPERHRSMQAVLKQTWTHLNAREQALLKRLAAFKSGFRREAAQSIADAPLSLLSSLLDKCLLLQDAMGRYHIHKLLRQYVSAMLDASELAARAEAHCRYYCDFLAQRNLGMVDQAPVTTILEIEGELGNIRVAWQNAIKYRWRDALEKCAAPYFYFCQMQSRYLEYAEAAEQALEVLEQEGDLKAVAHMLVYQGWMLIRIGRFDRAVEGLERSRVLFEKMQLVPDYGMGSHPIAPLIILHVIQGDYAEAVALGEKLKDDSAARGDTHNLTFACYGLTSAYLNQEEYEAALRNAEEAVQLVDDIDNHLFGAYCHMELGNVHRAMGHDSEADLHYREGVRLNREYRDPDGVALTTKRLGALSLLRQDYQTAQQLYEHSLSIYQKLNDKIGLAAVHQSLGQIAYRAEAPALAARHFREALDLAYRINAIPLLLSLLIDIGVLMIDSHHKNRGTELLRLVHSHPASHPQQQENVESLLDRIPSPVDVSISDLNATVVALQIELLDLMSDSSPIKQSPLIEPLTDRELDVLQLIAQGLSNPAIAEQLHIAVGTVKAHTNRIYGKLGVENRVQATIRARELSLLSDRT